MSLPNLEHCRSAQEDLMRETVEVWLKSETATDSGGRTATFTKNATTIGRVGPIGRDPSDRETISRLNIVMPYGVTVPHDTVVNEHDRLVIGTRTFEVMAVIRRTFNTALRCICNEVV